MALLASICYLQMRHSETPADSSERPGSPPPIYTGAHHRQQQVLGAGEVRLLTMRDDVDLS